MARPRSRAEWRAIVARWRDSDLTTAEFCRLEGTINPKTLRWWSSRLNRDPRFQGAPVRPEEKLVHPADPKLVATPTAAFLPVDVVHRAPPVHVEESGSMNAPRAGLEIVLPAGSRRVLVHGAFDPSVLRDVLLVLEAMA